MQANVITEKFMSKRKVHDKYAIIKMFMKCQNKNLMKSTFQKQNVNEKVHGS